MVVVHGLSSCESRALENRLGTGGPQASLPSDMWDLPGPGIESASLAMQGGFLSTWTTREALSSCFLIFQNSSFLSLFSKELFERNLICRTNCNYLPRLRMVMVEMNEESSGEWVLTSVSPPCRTPPLDTLGIPASSLKTPCSGQAD